MIFFFLIWRCQINLSYFPMPFWLHYLTCIGLRSLVLLWRRFFGFTCRSSSAKLTDEAKPSEPIVSSSENVASFSESKLISNPESEPSRPYKHFGSMVAKRLVVHKHWALDHRTLAGTRSGVGGSAVLLLDKCNTLITAIEFRVGVYFSVAVFRFVIILFLNRKFHTHFFVGNSFRHINLFLADTYIRGADTFRRKSEKG